MSDFRREFDRRDFLQLSLAASLGVSCSGWLPRVAYAAQQQTVAKRCILLWMAGGPAQTDTFDLKPNHPNGGTVKPIATSAPGIQISEKLPGMARQMEHLAIVRSLTSKEGDHQRGTQLMLTGYAPRGGNLHYPVLGSMLSHELAPPDGELPPFVSVSPFQMSNLGPGLLGPKYAPLTVSGQSNDPATRANLTVENLRPSKLQSPQSLESRFGLLHTMQADFRQQYPGEATEAQIANYDKAINLVRTEARGAFKLNEESAEVRDAYGRNRFGQGCLLARRLVERGVSCVEVTLAGTDPNSQLGWDTHSNSASQVGDLCDVLDPAWATLMRDLHDRGLLDSTLVIWMGEFGRTPKINQNAGRDHFPTAWSMVLGGARIRGGQAYGDTGRDGEQVVDNPVTVPQLYATICAALDIDPTKDNISPQGRPVGIVDGDAAPIDELLQS
ncbi:MAG: DUF1501 domain-containing protein [Planctomycetaceae bacterium]